MPNDKVKILQKDFNEIYEIIPEITGETPDVKTAKQEDTTPEFLTEEEEEFDKQMHQDNPEEALLE